MAAEIDKRTSEERREAMLSFQGEMDDAGICNRDQDFWWNAAAFKNAGTMLDREWASKTIWEIEHVIASAVSLRERMFADDDPDEEKIKEALESLAVSSVCLVNLAKDRLKNPRGRVPLMPDIALFKTLHWLVRMQRKDEALEILKTIETDDPGDTLRCGGDPVAAHRELIYEEVKNLLGLHLYLGGWDELLQALLAKFPSALTSGDCGRPLALALTPWPAGDRDMDPNDARKFKPPRTFLAKTLLLAGVRVSPGEHHVDWEYPACRDKVAGKIARAPSPWLTKGNTVAPSAPRSRHVVKTSFLDMVGNDTELAGLLIRAGHPLRFKGAVRVRDEWQENGFMEDGAVEEVDEDFIAPRLNNPSKSVAKKWRTLFDSMPEVLDELTEKASGGEHESKSI
jgi:hypothetical protein